MKVDVALTNHFKPEDLKVKVECSVVAVIDIIRATSTLAVLFGNGIREVTIAQTIEQAINLKKKYPEKILCGEENGLPPAGFDHGNSPLEFSRLDFSGKEAILKTTNGTVSFSKAKGSPAVYSLAALNFRVALEAVLQKAHQFKMDILFLCSGELGKVAYDDAYIAGLAVRDMMKNPGEYTFSDNCKLVLSAALGDSDIKSALGKSTSAISLRRVGLPDDIPFCARLNEYNVVVKAVFRKGMTGLEKA